MRPTVTTVQTYQRQVHREAITESLRLSISSRAGGGRKRKASTVTTVQTYQRQVHRKAITESLRGLTASRCGEKACDSESPPAPAGGELRSDP